MILNVIVTGSNRDSSGKSGINLLNIPCKNVLGKGKAQLAQTPLCLASSMDIQRSIPLLWTTMISVEIGEKGGSLKIIASCSAKTSRRLLVYILRPCMGNLPFAPPPIFWRNVAHGMFGHGRNGQTRIYTQVGRYH